MTCQELSDRMPAVAAGAATWSQEEAEHLRTCADCRAEWAVVSAGRVVGAQASIDADALAARVLHRLRTEPVVRRFPRRYWLIGLAAAAVIAIVLLPARLPRGPAAPLSSGPAAPPVGRRRPGLDALAADGAGRRAGVLDDLVDRTPPPPTRRRSTTWIPRNSSGCERSWEI